MTDMQLTIKVLKNKLAEAKKEGLTDVKLNSKYSILQKEYDRLYYVEIKKDYSENAELKKRYPEYFVPVTGNSDKKVLQYKAIRYNPVLKQMEYRLFTCLTTAKEFVGCSKNGKVHTIYCDDYELIVELSNGLLKTFKSTNLNYLKQKVNKNNFNSNNWEILKNNKVVESNYIPENASSTHFIEKKQKTSQSIPSYENSNNRVIKAEVIKTEYSRDGIFKLPLDVANCIIKEKKFNKGSYWYNNITYPTNKAKRRKEDFVTIYTEGFGIGELCTFIHAYSKQKVSIEIERIER